MRIDRHTLSMASQQGIISETQAENLWVFLKKYTEDIPSFNFTHILYYLGGLLAIGAMSLFMTLGWETLGGFGILALSILYAIIGILTTNYLFSKKWNIPASIIATFVVALTPLAIYGFQKGMGWWGSETFTYRDYHRWIDGLWIMMEFGTLLIGAIVFYFYRRPFLLLPVAVTLWYMSMDLVPFLLQGLQSTWEFKQFISMYVGIIMVLIAFWIDLRSKSKLDYAFHLYIFGVLAFWIALTSMHSDSELKKLIYCAINVIMIGIGAILSRRVFVVFGAMGIVLYLGHLSYTFFKDSILFPILLSFLGFAIIYLGILWSKHGAFFEQKLQRHLPLVLQNLLSKRQ